MKTTILKTVAFAIIFFMHFFGIGQTADFPNIKKDLIGEQPIWGSLNFEMSINGFSGGTIEGMYIKPNVIFTRVNAGLAFANNFTNGPDDDERLDFAWWSPIVNAEIGFPFSLGIRKSKKKYIVDQSYSSDNNGNSFRNTKYYKITVPQHFLLTPVVGVNYEISPFRIQEFADPSNVIAYNQRFMTLNAGVRLLKLIKSEVTIKDSRSNKMTNGSAHRFGGLYVGLDFALQEQYETGTGFTSIVKSERPTYEVVFSIPPGYVNTIAYIDLGIRSIPYVRKDQLDGNTDGALQFFFAFRSYL